MYSSQFEEYPEDVKKTYFEVLSLVSRLIEEFGDSIRIEVIDTASMKGVWKTAKYRVKKNLAIMIDGEKAFERIPTYEELKDKLIASGANPSMP